MKKQKIFRKLMSFVLVGVLISTPTSYVKASTGSSTSVNSNNSTVSSSGNGTGSGSNGWTYYNDDGYKLTTYILATTDLDYMNSLPVSLKKYIVNSREGMKQVKSSMGSATISTFIDKYTSTVSYFGKGSQTYIADYYQQLGNGMSIQVNNSTNRDAGYVGVVTSPQSHLSRFEEDGYKSSSAVTDDMVSKYRSEIKISPAQEVSVSTKNGKAVVNLGNFCKDPSKWIKIEGFTAPSSIESIKSLAGSKGFLQYAISNSMANGLYYTGVSCSNLSKFGISVHKTSGGQVTGKTIKVTEMVLDNSSYAFSMLSYAYPKSVTCNGYYMDGSTKVQVKFTCPQVDLLNAFLYRYQVDGEHYTWGDLCLDKGSSNGNFGIDTSIVVIIEPIKLNYCKGVADKQKYYGEFANESRNNSQNTNGLFMTIRERAYWLSGKRSTGLNGLKQKSAWTGSGESNSIDEKYSAGLCLNYVTGEGLSECSPIIRRLNAMMYSGDSYAEFPKVKIGSGSRCRNNKTFMYDGVNDTINPEANPVGGDYRNLTGGIACIGYYHEMDLGSTTSVNPFPSLTVRHIDNTALNDSDSNENVLMRDSITWTLPSSLGLAIENDVAKAAFLTENKGLLSAYGGNENGLSYSNVDTYISKVLAKNNIIRNRFGTGEVSLESKISLLNTALGTASYKYNGLNIKSMTFTQLLKGAYNKSGKSKTEFMQTVSKADKGDTEARSDYYSWCLDAIVDHYSDYNIRIPLLRNEDSDLSTQISSSNTYWGVSAKPLTSCSGSYEYYDGAIESADQTTQRKFVRASIENLNNTSSSDWDSISARDNENGTTDKNVLGETTNFVSTKLKFPGSRAASILDYNVEDGVTISNVCNNSEKGKLNFYYGSKFKTDRTVGSITKNTVSNISSSKMRDGSIDTGNGTEKSYLPTAKVTKSYSDVMYDLSIFNNSMGFMQKNNGQPVNNLVDGARQIRVSNLGGKNSWQYLIFPEYSLGSRMLMGHSCTNKLIDVDTYGAVGSASSSSDTSVKGERNTREPFMTYWSNTSYETHASSGNVNIRDNMFIGNNSQRAYNNVWVPDLGNNGADLNNAEIKASSSGVNGGQTVTGKMFEVTEKVYGVTLAYNPSMSSVDSWTYRIANGYAEEAKDINTNESNNIPSQCKVIEEGDEKLKADPFSDRCQALGVDETLFTMPDSITKLSKLNTGSNDRNFVKYTGTGWKFLNGKFTSAGTKKYSSLLNSNSTYTLNFGEKTKPNAYYVDVNVGDWISYGDLGTLDAYYDTVPTSKIYDISLDLDTDSEGMSSLDMETLLLSTDYGIKNAEITSGFTIEKQDTTYDMESNAKGRGYDSGSRKYIGTVSIKGDDIQLLSRTVSSGNRCISSLRSESILYQFEDKVVDLKAALTALEDEEVIYYINVWAKGDEDTVDIDGETFIRSDELVSAARVDIPDGSVELIGVEKPPEACGDSGHKFSSVVSSTWSKFNGKPKTTEPWKILGGRIVQSNPFTVLGKTENGTKKFGMDWLDDSLETWSKGFTGSGNKFTMCKGLSTGVLLHRSMLDTSSKDYSLSPPLASYMNGTAENRKYQNFCDDYDVPVSSCSGKGYNYLGNQYGWESKSAERTLGFKLFDAFNIGKGGDMDYETLYSTKYSCAVGDYVLEHSKDIQNDHYAIQGRYTDDKNGVKKVRVGIEGSYVGNNSDTTVKKPQLYTDKVIGGNDLEVVYKVPTSISFTPTYLMRADYDVENYEVNNQEFSAKKSEGNREKVWVLGAKERTMNVYNLYSLKITGAEEAKVQAPWSTDNKDKQHYKDTGKPTVKAGSAYKLSKTAVNLQVQSTVYLLDESFYSGSALNEVRAFNREAIKSHEELLDKARNCVAKSGENGSYSFIYTSLPGGYDEQLANKYSMFTNKFTNVVKGLRHEYSNSQFTKVFNKTKVKSKVNYYDVSTSVSANYLNKEYDDSEYTTSDYAGSRGMTLRIDGKDYNVNPSLLNVSSSVLLDTPVGEVSKAKNEALKEYYSQLQRATRAGKTWYKEDFEGILQVTITSDISLQLDSDYSIIWNNLSDWQDKSGVTPYNEAKPSEESYNGDSSVKLIKSNPNITNKIPAGEIGAGYGFLINGIELNGVDFGTTCLMLKPYLFEVRGNVYDDVSK